MQQRVVWSRPVQGRKGELVITARSAGEAVACQVHHQRHPHDGLQQEVQKGHKVRLPLEVEYGPEHIEDFRIDVEEENTEKSRIGLNVKQCYGRQVDYRIVWEQRRRQPGHSEADRGLEESVWPW